jgi:hypothetical protein
VVKVTKAGPNDKYGDVEGSWEKHLEAAKETMRYAYTGDLLAVSGNGVLEDPEASGKNGRRRTRSRRDRRN